MLALIRSCWAQALPGAPEYITYADFRHLEPRNMRWLLIVFPPLLNSLRFLLIVVVFACILFLSVLALFNTWIQPSESIVGEVQIVRSAFRRRWCVRRRFANSIFVTKYTTASIGLALQAAELLRIEAPAGAIRHLGENEDPHWRLQNSNSAYHHR